MGFLDNVKAAANDLKTSVDQQLSTSNAGRDAEKHFRDLGMLAYLKGTDRAIVDADWERIFGAIKQIEAAGGIPTFALHTSAPPPPGAAGAPSGMTPPPPAPPGGMAPPPPAPPAPPAAPPAGVVPPPPPPPPPGV